MSLKKINKKVIFIPIFNRALTIIQGEYTDIASYIKNSQNVDIEPCMGAYITANNQHFLLLTANATTLTILHELIHATYGIIDRIGANIKDEELFCYLYGFLITETSTLLNLPLKDILNNTYAL